MDLTEKLKQGVEAHHQNRHDAAAQAYIEVLKVDPEHADALHLMSILILNRGHAAAALPLMERAVAARSDAEFYNTLGAIRRRLQQWELAEKAYVESLKIDPNYAAAHGNFGDLLNRIGRPEEGRDHLLKAIELDPDKAPYWINLAMSYGELEDAKRGAETLAKALRLVPGETEARMARAVFLLAQGQCEEGWRLYEWRWAVRPQDLPPLPSWNGESIAGRHLLVHAEQGYGDIIHFARFLPHLETLGARVTAWVPQPLVQLFRDSNIDAEADRQGQERHKFEADYQVSLWSIPRALKFTDLTGGVSNAPYLRPDPKLADFWRVVMGPKKKKLRVGLVWKGNPNYPLDYKRSLTLETLLPLAQFSDDVEFMSFQKDTAEKELDIWPAPLRPLALELGSGFNETAAALTQVDLLISCDTALLHLAGALGLPAWAMLPIAPDWRWGLTESTNIWYPSIRSFRQTVRRDWNTVVAQMVPALKEKLEHSVAP